MSQNRERTMILLTVVECAQCARPPVVSPISSLLALLDEDDVLIIAFTTSLQPGTKG